MKRHLLLCSNGCLFMQGAYFGMGAYSIFHVVMQGLGDWKWTNVICLSQKRLLTQHTRIFVSVTWPYS